MEIQLRQYQVEAIQAGVDFLRGSQKGHGLIVAPTGCGKSIIIANIARELDAPVLVLQPSREILQQNAEKFEHYGYKVGVYSASAGRKHIKDVTLAMIGSIVRKPHLFEDFPYILVDECDLVNAKQGMYKEFFDSLGNVRILGTTATPYRLSSDVNGSILKFLTRTRPRVFANLLYYIQTADLFAEGYLSPLEYHKVKAFDRHAVKANSTGADFDERALQLHFFKTNFQDKVVKVVDRLMERGRKNALVFTRFVPEAEYIASKTGAVVVTAETPKAEREAIGNEFKAGRIRVVCNVGIYTTGFDHPALETVVLARPTRSLRLYYQMVGRAARPFPTKDSAWIVDMVGLADEFGRLEDLKIVDGGNGKWFIENTERVLTNVYFSASSSSRCNQCGSDSFFWMRHIETNNAAPLCRPPEGVEANIALTRNAQGKTVYRVVPVTDPSAEFINHHLVCRRDLHQ